MRKKEKDSKISGQIAVLFTLIIAVIFVLMCITINVGLLAKERTQLDSAAESAAYFMSSTLGSFAYQLSQAYFAGDKHIEDEREINIQSDRILCISKGFIKLVSAAVNLTLRTQGVSPSDSTSDAQTILSRVSSNSDLTTMINTTNEANRISYPSWLIEESAIRMALSQVVDDPMMVRDTDDYDEDGKNYAEDKDMVSRFTVWSALRSRNLRLSPGSTQPTGICAINFMDQLSEFIKTASSLDEYLSSQEFSNLRYNIIWYQSVAGYTVSEELWNWNPWSSPAIAQEAADFAYPDHRPSQLSGVRHLTDINYLAYGNSLKDLFFNGNNAWFSAINNWDITLGYWLRDLETALEKSQKSNPELASNIQETIKELKQYKSKINLFLGQASGFRYELNKILAGKKERVATYSWQDNRGWHHVRAIVPSPLNLPELSQPQIQGQTVKLDLLNPEGTIIVKVIRFDEDKAVYFAHNSNNLLWRFRYRKNPNEPALSVNLFDAETCLAKGIEAQAQVKWTYLNQPPERTN